MKSVNQSFGFLSDMTFSIPMGQVGLFALVCSVFLLLGKHKIGLLASYGFFYYWAFVLNRVYFMKKLAGTSGGVFAYGALGVVMALIAFVGFIKKSE